MRVPLPDPSPLNVPMRVTRSGRVVPRERRRKVALVCAGTSGSQAPINDRTWEVWGLNSCDQYTIDANGLFRADRWFELHDLDERVCKRRRAPGFRRWLASLPCPVYQRPGRHDAARSVPFPLDDVIAGGRDYFGCTMAYQVGLALREGFTTIGLFGAALNTGREALVERPTVEWWLGYAQGRGIRVIVPEYAEGTGRHAYRYAFDQVAERDASYAYCLDHLVTNLEYVLSRLRGLA